MLAKLRGHAGNLGMEGGWAVHIFGKFEGEGGELCSGALEEMGSMMKKE